MLLATALSLAAAVLHAGWNLAAKQSGDRFIALWGQFLVSGAIGAVVLVVWAVVDDPSIAWPWAVISGLVHVPYIVLLAHAYDQGDFSLAYPVARGGGALIAAVGGVVLLGDDLSLLTALGIGVAAGGLMILATGHGRPALTPALLVAATIGAYTLADSRGARESGSAAYALAGFVCMAVFVTVYGAWRGRLGDLRVALAARPGRFAATGSASALTYSMVLVAVQHAPVGYVTALRESSVVIAAFAGWRYLGEGDHRRRIASAAVVLVGLVLLVAGT